MKTATAPKPVVEEAPASMGSEYMDARSFVTQWTKAPRVKVSDQTFHGSNASDFGVEPVSE
jgi:hypothetical protein